MIVIFGDAAKIELVETIEWYEVQQKGLGKRFAQALDITKKRITIFPDISSEVAQGIRRAIIKGFPYGLIYSIHKETIEIIAVAHLHREPLYWDNRTQEISHH
ncbi:MAG TPA: type II toxin-antitoxin system RelE/ParE family toxin [Fibrobacteria bacterium]|nr:type II toxin-antitoxin system RelE/ParE family toxin [Fibrobacteria bacterium]